MLKTLQKLISIPSYSGEESKVLEFIKEELKSSGIRAFFQGKNLLAFIKGANASRAFIFNGHADVVDIGERSSWKYDPWGGKVVNGRIYGRGASDMKGGVWAMMETAKLLSKKLGLSTDVWFSFVVREETDGEGTKGFLNWFKKKGYFDNYRELAAIFAEPTGLTKAQHGHRGNYFIEAETTGIESHSSRQLKDNSNAVIKMNNFINYLSAQNLQWQKDFKSQEFLPPAVTVTSIEAVSVSPNKTSGLCKAKLDLRTVPSYHEKAFEKVNELAKKNGIALKLHHSPSPAGYTKPDSKLIKVFREILPEVTFGINDASNDLGFLTEAGIESLIFGPGEKLQAHRIDEYADIEQIKSAPFLYEKLYLKWAASV